MSSDGKSTLTTLSKREEIVNIILELLFIKEKLTNRDAEYLFAISLLFIEEFEKNRSRSYYIEFAYSIIVRTCFKINDYRALYDFSVNFGYYPIARKLLRSGLVDEGILNYFLSDLKLAQFSNGDKINTFEQDKVSKEIIASENKKFAFVAPTSYGKSEIIYQHILENNELDNIGIIVPTKALIDQVFREAKKLGELNRKIITHEQNYNDSDRRVLAIVTQERALRLIEQHLIFDSLYIDEAHELFNFDFGLKHANRSLLLARLLRLNKKLNPELNIYYFSPLIQNVNNLLLKNEEGHVEQYKINNNLKVLDIRYVSNANEQFVFEQYLGSFFKLSNTENNLKYIVNCSKNYKKNLHYLYRPIYIEHYAKELCNQLSEYDELPQSLANLIEELKDIVHPKFKLIKFLSKGILYLHGRLPNNIRNYLLKCFRDDASIKHLIANSVILAGMNMPIDSLFFISGFSATNELINLVGRVNRLNEIFSNNGELNKILVPVHFVELDSYPQNRNGQLKKTVESLRSNIKDSVKNPLLENSVVHESNLENSEKILALESNIVNDFDNPSFISRLTRSGAQQLLNYTELGLIKLEKIIQETEIIHNADNVYKEILLKVKEVFFDNFVNEGADRAIDYRYFHPNNNVKRLRFEPTINYYSVFIPSSYSSLKDRVNNLVSYWEDILSSSSDHNKNFMQYVGSQFGEKAYQSDDYNDSRAKVYIDLNDYKTREYDMYNIAIIKLQTDDEFVDFEIGLLVNSLREFNIISDDLYNLFMFGTNDIKELQISQLGLSKNLYNTLKKDNQIQNIEFDDFHNPRANHHLREYILSKQGIEKFELEQYFL